MQTLTNRAKKSNTISYPHCALSNSRLLDCKNSATKPAVSCPEIVAASISVVSRIDVATSALHSKQYFSLRPGSSNNSVRRLQTSHCKRDGCTLFFPPHAIDVPPKARASRVSTHRKIMLGKPH